MHPAFREFKQRFINFCAHFGYTRPHPFPADGDALGDYPLLPPPDAPARGALPIPPQGVPGPIAAEPAPRNPVGPILDGDDATSTDASSCDASSLTCAIVESEISNLVRSVTVID